MHNNQRSFNILLAQLIQIVCFFALFCSHVSASSPPLKVRLGVYENKPKVFTSENGQVAGIFPDILQVIARAEGWQLQYIHGSWTECLDRLEKGDIDIMVDVAFSESRAKKYDFSSETVFINWATVYSQTGEHLESLLDLQNKKIAVMKGSIHTDGEGGIKKLLEQFNINSEFVEVDNYQQVFSLLSTNAVSAGVVNRLFGTMHEQKYKVSKSSLIFNPRHLKYAFPKKSPKNNQLKERIDAYLGDFKNNPTSIYAQILESYLSGKPYAWEQKRPYGLLNFLNKEEKIWLSKHPKIRIGVDAGYAPYSFVTTSDQYQGLAMDFVELISKRLGVDMEVIPNLTWPEILENAKKKNLDVVITAVQTPERKEFLGFTKIYIPTPLAIMIRKDDRSIESSNDLSKRTVALVKDYSSTERVLKDHPQIQSHWVSNPLDGLMAVSMGEADAYVGVLGINVFQAGKHGIANLKVAARYDDQNNGQRLGVRKDWPELVTILDKTLDSIPESEKIALSNKWIPLEQESPMGKSSSNTIALTPKERAWIEQHPHIKFGSDPEFHPFEFISKDGAYNGIASDYVTLLNKRLGLNMQLVPDLSWSDSITLAKKGEIDILPCIGATEERKSYLKYSQPYLEFQRVIIMRNNTPFIAGIDDIVDLKVAVQVNTSHEGFVKEQTKIHPLLFPTLQSAILAVSNGRVDAFIGNIASATYWIHTLNLTNLKVAAPTYSQIQQLHFAVRKDWPELVEIINKGLDSISQAEKNEITRRWVHVEYKSGLDPSLLWKYVTNVLAGALIIFLLFTLWNYRLKREISQRKSIERRLKHSIDFERFITEISSQFINLKNEEISTSIEESLATIASFFDAQAAYLLTIENDALSVSCTHLWREEGLPFNKAAWQKAPPGDLSVLMDQIKKGEVCQFSNQSSHMHGLKEYRFLQKHGIQSMIVLPRSYQGKVIGFLGLCTSDSNHLWDNDAMSLLNLLGQIFTNALLRETEGKIRQKHAEQIEKNSRELQKSQEALTYLLEDVSEAKAELEAANEKLKDLDRLKSLFIASMSHELRTPLNSIIGFTGIILQGMAGEINEEQQDQLQRVYGSAKHLLALITDVIDISKIEAGRIDVYAEKFDFEKVVEEAVASISPKLKEKGLDLTIEVPASLQLYTDRRRLLQCTLNYLSNAVRYTEKGKISLVARVVDTFLEVKVIDSGIGINEQDIPKLFNSFVRLDSHLKTIVAGTGLGLYLTKKIATEMLKGKIGVESILGKGSTFILSIPLQHVHEEAQQ